MLLSHDAWMSGCTGVPFKVARELLWGGPTLRVGLHQECDEVKSDISTWETVIPIFGGRLWILFFFLSG